MEQPCYKCGQVLEEGRAFCPHCMAPQIRVVIAEPVGVAAVMSEAPSASIAKLPADETVPVLAVPVMWSQAVKPCLLAAVVASVLMGLGLNLFVAMISVGFLAVIFYRQGRPSTLIKPSSGMRMGALSGMFAFGLTALVVALASTVPEIRAKLHQQVLENAEKSAAAHPGYAQLQAAVEQLKTPEGFVAALIVWGVLLLLVSILLGGLGGALGAAILGRRDRS